MGDTVGTIEESPLRAPGMVVSIYRWLRCPESRAGKLGPGAESSHLLLSCNSQLSMAATHGTAENIKREE
jgi:hypothetical protein